MVVPGGESTTHDNNERNASAFAHALAKATASTNSGALWRAAVDGLSTERLSVEQSDRERTTGMMMQNNVSASFRRLVHIYGSAADGNTSVALHNATAGSVEAQNATRSTGDTENPTLEMHENLDDGDMRAFILGDNPADDCWVVVPTNQLTVPEVFLQEETRKPLCFGLPDWNSSTVNRGDELDVESSMIFETNRVAKRLKQAGTATKKQAS